MSRSLFLGFQSLLYIQEHSTARTFQRSGKQSHISMAPIQAMCGAVFQSQEQNPGSSSHPEGCESNACKGLISKDEPKLGK